MEEGEQLLKPRPSGVSCSSVRCCCVVPSSPMKLWEEFCGFLYFVCFLCLMMVMGDVIII